MHTLHRVLVVEDNPAMANVIKFNLNRSSMDAQTASNGKAALDLLQAQAFDLVITDYQMPIMDGRELCQAMRQCSRLRGIPVIMLTAKELEVIPLIDMPDLGIDHVCSKPFSPSELTGLVVDILNRRPAIDVRVAAEVAEDADQI